MYFDLFRLFFAKERTFMEYLSLIIIPELVGILKGRTAIRIFKQFHA